MTVISSEVKEIMDPKHLIKALAIAYLQEHGDRIKMTAVRLIELQRMGDIKVISHDNKIFDFVLDERAIHTLSESRDALAMAREIVTKAGLPHELPVHMGVTVQTGCATCKAARLIAAALSRQLREEKK